MQGSGYTVDLHRFENYFAALEHSQQTNKPVEYTVPQWHIDAVLDVDVPHTMQYSAEYWIDQKLSLIKETFRTTRLQYTGGTDSHTLLLRAYQLGFQFDYLWTCTCGLTGDPYYDEEFLPALTFLENNPQYVKTQEVFQATEKDFEFWLDHRSPYTIPRFEFTFRPHFRQISMRDCEPVNACITGHNKPVLYNKNGTYYWLWMDSGDAVDSVPNIVTFFEDGMVPELGVNQAYLAKHFWQRNYPAQEGILGLKHLPDNMRPQYNRVLGRSYPLTPELDIKHFCRTNPINEMHHRSISEIAKIGRMDIIHGWHLRRMELIEKFKDTPDGITLRELRNPLESTVPLVVPHRVGRIAAMFELGEHSIKLVNHNQVLS